jgi:hypothetical protein
MASFTKTETQTKTKTKDFDALYEEWITSPDKKGLTTKLLRKEFKKSDGSVQPGQNKAHWLDLELAAYALKHVTGPKPSKEYIQSIREVLRNKSNWRPLGEKKNQDYYGLEKETVKAIIGAYESNKTVKLSGAKLSKVKHQVEFLINQKDNLPPALVNKLTDMLKMVRDPVDPKKHLISKKDVKNPGINLREEKSKQPNTPPRSDKKKSSNKAASPGSSKNPDERQIKEKTARKQRADVKAKADKAKADKAKADKAKADKAKADKAKADKAKADETERQNRIAGQQRRRERERKEKAAAAERERIATANRIAGQQRRRERERQEKAAAAAAAAERERIATANRIAGQQRRRERERQEAFARQHRLMQQQMYGGYGVNGYGVSLGGYGSISSSSGNARTSYVSGYTRSNGTHVKGYYRS